MVRLRACYGARLGYSLAASARDRERQCGQAGRYLWAASPGAGEAQGFKHGDQFGKEAGALNG